MKRQTTKKRSKSITTEEFDSRFDAGEDSSEYVDWSRARVVEPKVHRINVDFTAPMVVALDRVASALGVTRQSLIKLWIAEKLQSSKNRNATYPGFPPKRTGRSGLNPL